MGLARCGRRAGSDREAVLKNALTGGLLLCLALQASAAAPARRLVSLAPHLTEIAYAAGAGTALVGTVEYSDYPEQAQRLPQVGNAWRIDFERLLALRPDAVLVWSGGTPQQNIDRLRRLGMRIVEVPTNRIADIPVALRSIGTLTGNVATAARAAAEFERAIAAERKANAGKRRLSVFIQIDDDPLFTVNGAHVISEVVALCGGSNVFADLSQTAPAVAMEAVVTRDPQVILSTDDTVTEPYAGWSRWPRLTAVRSRTVYPMPSDVVARASPRLVQGVRAVCAALDDARLRLVPSGIQSPRR
jgi:iron complex transport system substrate-binding protein